jgi:hypothetical protein
VPLVIEARIQRAADGELRLRLPREERLVLRGVAAKTRERLRDDDPALRRLFPPAYDDAELESEYRELTRRQLTSGREQALELLEATVDNTDLSPVEADSWLRALNDVRLVLGTELDVTEDLDWDALDSEDPRLPRLSLYAYVSWIQEQLVEALG